MKTTINMNPVNKATDMNSTNSIMSLTDRITAFVRSQCYDANEGERALFGFDGDDTQFYVGHFSDDSAIPCKHVIPIEDFAVIATLREYSDGKARYVFEVIV